jgi:virginiamycin B lyase
VVDAKGRPWFNEFGTNKLGTLDPDAFQLKEYVLRDPSARGRRIALGKDGGIWYVDYGRGFLARLDPGSGAVREWPMPGGPQSLPYAMAADDRGRMWAVETGPQPNRLVGFDPESASFFASAEIPSGAGTVRHMVFEARRRQLWFGTDHGTIGRATVP